MVDSIFLKSPRRIESLMMIMTLCLMIYNVGQYRLRSALKGKRRNSAKPNQKAYTESHITMDFSNYGGN